MFAVALTACNHHTCQQDTRSGTSRAEVGVPFTLDDYERVVYGPGPGATFVPTSAAEHQVLASLIPELLERSAAGELDAAALNALRDPANSVGFRIETWTLGGERYVALLEAKGKARGAGAYIFRVAPLSDAPALLLEAPHHYYDVGTGRLAAELFFLPKRGVRPRALFTNTIHRYQLAPGDKGKRKDNPADVAHNAEHAFSIATHAFVSALVGARVVQLHGFGKRLEDGDSGDGELGAISMVVSAGDSAGSSAWSTAIASALVTVFGSDVKRYPEDVRILGATTNAQGQMLRNLGADRFVHVEMSAELRGRLSRDAELRSKLAAALFDSVPRR